MERFFLVIRRINSLLLLLALLGFCGVMLFVADSFAGGRRHQDLAVPVQAGAADKEMIYLSIGQIEKVAGSHTQMLRLEARRSAPRFSSGGSGSETRNLLFLSDPEKKPRWLFADNSHVVADVRQLPENYEGKANVATQILLFRVVAPTGSSSGKSEDDEGGTVAVSHPDGTGYTELLSDVRKVISQELLDGNTIGIVYQKDKKIIYGRYTLDSFQKLGEQVITELPEKF